MVKKSANINIANFNKIKKSCLVVKSKLNSFVCAIIIALSLPENSKCAYVKKNRNFLLKNWERRCQPKTLFKTLSDKLNIDAAKFLKFAPTKIKHWRLFLLRLGFNLVIFCFQSHFKIINEKYLRCNIFSRNIFIKK